MRQTILIAALLGGCAAPAAEREPPPTAADESLSFEASSWGKPLSAWTIESSGRGRYTASTPAPSGKFRDYDLVTRAFAARPADFRRVEALLRPARAYAGADLPCRLTVTDAVYGKVRWAGPGGMREVSFNAGCTSQEVAPLYAAFREAQDLVEGFAAAGTMVETREIREPEG